MEEFTLTQDYIELIRLLKLLQWVPSGGIAKMVVEDELVFVNGELEFRKRRKLVNGDVVEFDGMEVKVVSA
ncbi:MAG: RNA-binding S4 domain-containing protein [Flavobacteriales bacterium]|nr:RNA-binding S4 domain-containing protein [Flavobacteriales bacterium]